jgi:tetratricopeptide (TPR) repeat protein
LAGTVAMKAGNYDAAIKFLKIAVEVEENMVYNEPRDWLLNPKHYLGDAYLKAGRYKESVETLKKDLLNNNDNAWALHGLLRAYQMDKRSSDVNLVMQKISKLYPKKKLEPLKLTGAVL